jgi:hypothetical protein
LFNAPVLDLLYLQQLRLLRRATPRIIELMRYQKTVSFVDAISDDLNEWQWKRTQPLLLTDQQKH